MKVRRLMVAASVAALTLACSTQTTPSPPPQSQGPTPTVTPQTLVADTSSLSPSVRQYALDNASVFGNSVARWDKVIKVSVYAGFPEEAIKPALDYWNARPLATVRLQRTMVEAEADVPVKNSSEQVLSGRCGTGWGVSDGTGRFVRGGVSLAYGLPGYSFCDPSTVADKAFVLAHEIGHMLGLAPHPMDSLYPGFGQNLMNFGYGRSTLADLPTAVSPALDEYLQWLYSNKPGLPVK